MGIDPFRNSSGKSAYYCVLHKPSRGIPEKIKNKKVFSYPTTFFWGFSGPKLTIFPKSDEKTPKREPSGNFEVLKTPKVPLPTLGKDQKPKKRAGGEPEGWFAPFYKKKLHVHGVSKGILKQLKGVGRCRSVIRDRRGKELKKFPSAA